MHLLFSAESRRSRRPLTTGFTFARRARDAVAVCLVASSFALAAAPVGQAAAGEPSLAPAPKDLVTPAHAMDPTKPAAPFDGLLKRLQQKGNIAATFTENRYLPLKKIPVVFTGEIRLSRERGLSLHYLTPQDQMMIVDERGVLGRNAVGKSREIASDPRAAGATTALLHVMRFDLDELSKQFSTYAEGDLSQWHFGFEPKNEALAKSLSRLVVTGEHDQVRRIVMRGGAVEILIHDVRENVTFTPDEVQRFFR